MIIPQVGHIIRAHQPDTITELARIVWVEQGTAAKEFVYIMYPELQESANGRQRRRHHIKGEQRGDIATLNKSIDALEISLVRDEPRSERLLTDEELEGADPQVGLLRRTRRNLKKWKEQRDKDLGLIAPILKKYTPHQLFGERLLDRAVQQRAKALTRPKKGKPPAAGKQRGEKPADPAKVVGDTSRRKALALRIEQTLRRYFLYGATPNALLPHYFNSGGLGTVKFCKSRTGRPERKSTDRVPRTSLTVRKLQIGYRRHMKKGVSYQAAFDATLHDMWAQSVTYVAHNRAEVKLVPESQRPTLAEFIRVAKAEGLDRSPAKFALGAVAFASRNRDRYGTAKDGIHAVGQIGILDSTSEDHVPVSSACRLLHLPVPWRTMITDGYVDYIFGVHRGFEHGGTSAGLFALYHAEQDKLEWADKEEIHLKKGEWLSMAFLTVRGDHGDLKSERGIQTLTASEMSLEIVRSYTPHWKAVEPVHQQMHVASDHRQPGSNFGEIRSRGERPEESFLKFREGWPGLVRSICFHNNEQLVPHLLTLPMRRAGVKPTRRDIVMYCLAEGLVASQPSNQVALRAACAAPIAAQGHAGRIEVWDPRVPKGQRKVPEMFYFGEFMNSSEWKSRPVRDIEIGMNPSRVGEAFINFGGLQTLRLLHRDHERDSLTLADWLFIGDNDRLVKFLERGRLEEERASIHASNLLTVAAAKADKDAQAAAAGGALPTRSRSSAKKRKALESEAEHLRLHKLGLAPPAATGTPGSTEEASDPAWKRAASLPALVDEDDSEMEQLREKLR